MTTSRRATLLLLLPAYVSAAYLGLRNQGNTCYMNSLLQTLHHLPEFREAIYSIPTQLDNSSAIELVPLELQRVFYELQHAEEHGSAEVGTEQLTRSFGWGRREVMEQQDVQEFARMLCDALQSAFKAHGVRDAVSDLFEGRTASLTRCTRVPFSSEKEERFYDLSLQVQGCPSLHHSLRDFVKEETLKGDNAYNTRDPTFGKQEARRGVRFKSLPPILLLHLKRFEYDYASGDLQKLQTEFTFPTRLKLHRYMARQGAERGKKLDDFPRGSRGRAPPASPDYELCAVLSHVGEFGSGHYVSYVQPSGGRQWYEFDDTRVTAVREEVAVRQQYGGRFGKSGGMWGRAKPNAYMLAYVRRDVRAGGCEPTGDVLPADVRKAFDRTLRGEAAPARGVAASILEEDPAADDLFG